MVRLGKSVAVVELLKALEKSFPVGLRCTIMHRIERQHTYISLESGGSNGRAR